VTSRGRLLLIDDDPGSLSSLHEALSREGYEVTAQSSGEEALKLRDHTEFDVVVTDLRMPGVDGLQVVRAFKAAHPETVVIVMTGFASMETVVDAIAAGAYDYISKPFRLDQMRLKIRQSLEQAKLLRENRDLRERVQEDDLRWMIIGSSPPMVEVFKTLAKVASTDATVLITGESGTGKELVARAIHRLGPRKDRTFLAVNCSSVSESLLESELFGYVKGAFTGAAGSRRGIFEAGDHGTVFLDEIGDTSPGMQAKLLRVLESGEVMPVGSTAVIRVDVRTVAATNKDLSDMVARGKFREDLFYRLNVVTIPLPPLRDRISDLPLLFDFFLKKYSARNRKTLAVHPDVLPAMSRFPWPGNVRQLENVVERAVALNTSGVFAIEDLPREIVAGGPPPPPKEGAWLTMEQMEERYIREVIEATGGNMSKAAEILGIDRRTLYRKLDTRKDADETEKD
jgi:two-component system, NtrC family, response regulator AtoC